MTCLGLYCQLVAEPMTKMDLPWERAKHTVSRLQGGNLGHARESGISLPVPLTAALF